MTPKPIYDFNHDSTRDNMKHVLKYGLIVDNTPLGIV